MLAFGRQSLPTVMNPRRRRIAFATALMSTVGSAQLACSSSDQPAAASGGASSSAASGSAGLAHGGAGSGGNGATNGGSGGSAAQAGAGDGSSMPSGGSAALAGSGGTAAGGASNGGSAGEGQASGSVAFAADRVVVTGVRGTASPAAASTIQLHNGGASAVSLGLLLSGTHHALFRIASPTALPVSLAPGADLTITIEMSTSGADLPPAPANKDLGSVLLTATLTATFGSSQLSASVYGLVLTQVNYEPTLGQVLTTLGYPLNVGKAQNNWNPNTSMDATSLPGIEPGSDEVAASHFVKAGAGNVELRLVARFSPFGELPYGWYTTTSGCPTGCTTVGSMARLGDAQTSDKARMVHPPLKDGSATEFDPGSAPFGLWIYSDQKTQKFMEGGNMVNGDWDYSQDALNSPANVHRFKSYPLKDASGAAVPHSYLVAVEEAGNGDYQDYVFVLRNVTAMP
jgi:hypothetical protein